MNYKTKILIAILALSIVATTIYFTKTFTDIVAALFLFSCAGAGSLISLFFAKEVIFQTWRKFTLVWVPLSFLAFVLSSETYVGIVGFDKKITATWMALFFFVISLVIIIHESIKLGRE